jgi:preprotein translocase subunit SecE
MSWTNMATIVVAVISFFFSGIAIGINIGARLGARR